MNNDESLQRQAMQLEVERDITPGLPRAERAVAFVRTRGMATSSELHMVMELEQDELVSHHLAEPLADGRLIKDGKHWTPGVGQAVAEPQQALECAVPRFIPPQDVNNVAPISSPRMARVKDAPKPASSSAPAIRCGLWSDGHVEIQRDGQTKALLAVEEMVYLADFWSRIANSIKEAS